MAFLVIENTPGYLPDEDDPAEFEEYADAVEDLNDRVREYEEEGLRVEVGLASSDNLAAVRIWDDSKIHDLGRVIAIVRAEDDLPEGAASG